MNYIRFGGTCTDDFLAGLSDVSQHRAASDVYWSSGSDNTTQVNYASFGSSCYYSFIAGLSAITQSSATSYKNWHDGS